MVSAFDCPKCQSQQTQKVSVLCSAGTTTGRSNGVGVGLAFDGSEVTPAIGGMGSRINQQTALAKSLAPPQKPESDFLPLLGFAVLLLIGIALFAGVASYTLQAFPGPGNRGVDPPVAVQVLIVALAGILLIGPIPLAMWGVRPFLSKAAAKRQEEYLLSLWKWNNSWFCHRCGHVFLKAN